MNCTIFYRVNGGALRMVTTDDGSPGEFLHHDEAVHYAERTVLSESDVVDYQVVALDELWSPVWVGIGHPSGTPTKSVDGRHR